ncbi:AAA family ATPase [Thermodesulfobium sp. 4217-1]|uniref:AAA family ATPase n=1 Tax=Thermodesulfobium sp. 4217-1 TaxID=3120013 RepID=UPI003221FBA7
MFKKLSIENFRGFNKFSIDGLSDINIFTGANGCGKTSVLEAVFLLSSQSRTLPININSLHQFRTKNTYLIGFFSPSPFEYLFKDITKPIVINSEDTTLEIKPITSEFSQFSTTASPTLTGIDIFLNGEHQGKYSWHNNIIKDELSGKEITNEITNDFQNILVTTFISPYFCNIEGFYITLLSNMIKNGKRNEILKLFQMFHPEIKDFTSLSDRGTQTIFVDIGTGRYIPISLLGTGFLNFIDTILPVFALKNSIILIDEIEDGVYYLYVPKLLKTIFEIARENNNQLFITTHSKELLLSIVSVIQDLNKEDSISFFNINFAENVDVDRYSIEDVKNLMEINLDIR